MAHLVDLCSGATGWLAWSRRVPQGGRNAASGALCRSGGRVIWPGGHCCPLAPVKLAAVPPVALSCAPTIVSG